MVDLITERDIFADLFWMDYLCSIACNQEDDVPVAACAVDSQHRLIATAVNKTVANNDPCAHAEIELLRELGRLYGNHRLVGINVYVTLEPCIMCYGALLHARVKRLVFGCSDFKFGVLSRHSGLQSYGELNHKLNWLQGIRSDNCSSILLSFFEKKRS